MNELKKRKCPRCEYEWDCYSEHWLVSCPSCGFKVKNTNVIKIGKNKMEDNL
jgi:hypothetical protein